MASTQRVALAIFRAVAFVACFIGASFLAFCFTGVVGVLLSLIINAVTLGHSDYEDHGTYAWSFAATFLAAMWVAFGHKAMMGAQPSVLQSLKTWVVTSGLLVCASFLLLLTFGTLWPDQFGGNMTDGGALVEQAAYLLDNIAQVVFLDLFSIYGLALSNIAPDTIYAKSAVFLVRLIITLTVATGVSEAIRTSDRSLNDSAR